MDYTEKKNLYKCRHTVLEMLADRGYAVPSNFYLDFENFALLLEENNLDIHLIKNETDAIYVRFMFDYAKNLTKKDLDAITEEIRGETDNPDLKIILIIKNNPSKNNQEMLDKIKNVQIFCQDYLVFNPTHHYMVPQHILLSKEEEMEVLKKYRCTKAQLPKLPSSDPIAKYFGMESGNICKIIRNNTSMGEHIYYRHIR